jgi:hypothetical protein
MSEPIADNSAKGVASNQLRETYEHWCQQLSGVLGVNLCGGAAKPIESAAKPAESPANVSGKAEKIKYDRTILDSLTPLERREFDEDDIFGAEVRTQNQMPKPEKSL